MKKKLQGVSKWAPWVLSVIGCLYMMKNPVPARNLFGDESSFHFDLMTVSALFGGFLYTNYSLLVGLLDNKIVEKLKNTDIIQKRNEHIIKGIVYSVISVVAGLLLALKGASKGRITTAICCFAQSVEIVFLVFCIVYFILSLKEMNALIAALHVPTNKKSENEISELKDEVINYHSNK